MIFMTKLLPTCQASNCSPPHGVPRPPTWHRDSYMFQRVDKLRRCMSPKISRLLKTSSAMKYIWRRGLTIV